MYFPASVPATTRDKNVQKHHKQYTIVSESVSAYPNKRPKWLRRLVILW
jgi:hypothetical protein